MALALFVLGVVLGAGSWVTNAHGRAAIALLAAEGASFLLVFTGG